MATIQVLTKRQELLTAMRLLSQKVITETEYNEIQQSYMDIYLIYMEY